MTGLIIFASKYGSTREYAWALSHELAAPAMSVGEVSPTELASSDYLVIGSPIYGYSVLPAMAAFLKKIHFILLEKPYAVFVVCGDTAWNSRAGEGGGKNLEKLTRLLPGRSVASGIFGGRLRVDDLDEVDRPRIFDFYARLGREPLGFDSMDLSAVVPFAAEIKRATSSP